MSKACGVLFLCTGNSARSILAEATLNKLGAGRFHAHSAGSHPTGRVNPHALALLTSLGYPTDALRSKSWDEFAADGAPPLDVIITVCDNAAGEVCPIWPGRPAQAHWGVADPAVVTGDEAKIAAAFRQAFETLRARIEALLLLPIDQLDPTALKRALAAIGENAGEATSP